MLGKRRYPRRRNLECHRHSDDHYIRPTSASPFSRDNLPGLHARPLRLWPATKRATPSSTTASMRPLNARMALVRSPASTSQRPSSWSAASSSVWAPADHLGIVVYLILDRLPARHPCRRVSTREGSARGPTRQPGHRQHDEMGGRHQNPRRRRLHLRWPPSSPPLAACSNLLAFSRRLKAVLTPVLRFEIFCQSRRVLRADFFCARGLIDRRAIKRGPTVLQILKALCGLITEEKVLCFPFPSFPAPPLWTSSR